MITTNQGLDSLLPPDPGVGVGRVEPLPANLAAGSIPRDLPRHLRDRLAEPAIQGQRSEQTAALVGAAVEWGLDDGQILAMALEHAPTREKYDGRVGTEVGRLLGKHRPSHQHTGLPCDKAACANTPRWMTGTPDPHGGGSRAEEPPTDDGWEPPAEDPLGAKSSASSDTPRGPAGTGPAGEQADEPKRSQATILVQLAEDLGADLFHTDAHDAWATIPVAHHRETWQVKAKPFRRWLARLFYEREGKAPGSQGLQDALGVLEGKALFEGTTRTVPVRVVEHQGAIWLDLANEAWEAVEVTVGGWRVVASTDVPVRFRRPEGRRALPTPQPGGSLKDLRRFVNVNDDDWPLVQGFLVAALRPRGPYPVLNLLAPHGSAKTTTAWAIIRLIDPGKAELRGAPASERDLAIAASNAHVVGYDNLSKIDTWLSDALCRLATGGGLATRQLYSDDEETLFEYQRPVILTGIEELAIRGDLADRSLLVDLPSIDEATRRDEEDFWSDYEQDRPRLLGALLDAISTALRCRPEVKLDQVPRMADFALWVVAAAPSLDLEPADFLKAYDANRAAANAMAVEASPVAAEVSRLIRQRECWEGTATGLLADLNANADGSVDRRARSWPKNAKALSDALRRVKPNLSKVGVRVEFSQSHHPRTIKLDWVGEGASPASPASQQAPEQAKLGDAGGDAGDAPGTHGDAAPDRASPPETGSDQHEQRRGDAGDAGDAPPAISSNGQVLPTHRCTKCGKEWIPQQLVASYPHTGCGGLWQPLEETTP
jgi:hypothetical protein